MNAFRAPRVVSVALVAMLVAGCGGSSRPAASAAPTAEALEGHYVINGGGGAAPAAQALTAEFTRRHPKVTFEGLKDIGSDPGVTLVANGDLDLGYISRDLKPAEIGTVETVSLGFTGTGLLVNANSPVKNLERAQVAGVFTGGVADWGELGLPPGKVTVLIREAGPLRSSFEGYFFPRGAPTYAKAAVQLNNGDEMLRAATSLTGAIGMVTIDATSLSDQRIRLIAVDGVVPTKENVATGAYKVSRPLYLTYRAKVKLPTALQAFIDFVRGPDGQNIIKTA